VTSLATAAIATLEELKETAPGLAFVTLTALN
jgi:hypothetical protein